MKRLFTLALLSLSFYGFSQSPPHFITGEIIVKIKSEYSNKCAKNSIQITDIENLIRKNSITAIEKLFPKHKQPKQLKSGQKFVDLSTIYTFKIDPLSNPKKIIAQLQKNETVAYAEEKVLNELTYTPNDRLNGSQWYLGAIDVFRAWDIQKGDTTVVIAFTDTGTDTDHPDMVENYAYNYNDPINGIDDDMDGYIDNFLGWDVADNDNDVGFGNSGHGINVGGLASAVTDNVTGLSGAGFNTRLLPIKIDQSSSGRLTAAYEGIVYAADHGAFIITNSWGSTVYRQYAQDVVNYATLNKGCLVIAATGNNGFENRFYPAAYDNVLSVGSLTTPDTVKTNSNYGYWTDLMAPGDNMLTTNAIGGYGTNGGTSMAAPVVAGVAGLVKAQFPKYTWQQVTEQILNNATNIDRFNDSKYTGKIGSGRVNAFLAVSDSSKPGIVFQNYSITDSNDETFLIGDTLRISGAFINLLKDATNTVISVTTIINNKLQNVTNTLVIGVLNSLDSVENRSNPFEFIVPQNIGFNEVIEFEITITADSYVKKQYFSTSVNSDYLTVNENNLTVTLTSNGALGFAATSGQLGEGIKYKNGNSLLYEGSFILASAASFVGNNFRGSTSGTTDDDFTTSRPIRPITAKSADFQTFNSFDLNNSPSINFNIENTCYIFKHNQANNSIIYEYEITNTGNIAYSDLYSGLILDWDIANFSNNKIGFDPARNMGISLATDTTIFCGVRILTDTSISKFHYAIDNALNGNGGVNITDGFTDAEKVQVLSTDRAIGGNSSNEGNDIIDVNSMGPFSLNPGESFYVSFLITVSDSLESLQIESDTLKKLYEQIVLSAKEITSIDQKNALSVFPNPATHFISLKVTLAKRQDFNLNIYDLTGKLAYFSKENTLQKGTNILSLQEINFDSGVYFVELIGEGIRLQQKFVVAN
jgi:serine protease